MLVVVDAEGMTSKRLDGVDEAGLEFSSGRPDDLEVFGPAKFDGPRLALELNIISLSSTVLDDERVLVK